MARILTGIQSTGRPHLGNLLGAIIPAIQLSQEKKSQTSYKTYQKNFGYLNNDSHEEYR